MKLTKIVAFALVAMLLVFAVSCAPEAEKKHVHEKGTPHDAVVGTCRTKGALAYWDCTGCDAKLDADSNVLASIETPKNPSNHDSSSFRYSFVDKTHYPVCRCGTAIYEMEEPHNVVAGKCTVCEYVE